MINSVEQLLALASVKGADGVVQTGPHSYKVDGVDVSVNPAPDLLLVRPSQVNTEALQAAIASGRVQISDIITNPPHPASTTTGETPPRFEDEHQLLSATPPLMAPPPGLQRPGQAPPFPSWGDADRGAVPPPAFPGLSSPFSGMYPTPDDMNINRNRNINRNPPAHGPRFDPPGPPFL